MGKVSGPRKKNKWIIRLIFLLAYILIALISAYFSYSYVIRTSSSGQKEVVINIDPERARPIEIPLGSNTAQIAEILKQNGVIENTTLFRIISKLNGYDGLYMSGIHLIDSKRNYDNIQGYDMLMRILTSRPQDNPSITVTIPEGYTFEQIIDRLEKLKLIDRKKFIEVCNTEEFDYEFIKYIPKERENRLEGYLFPETYKFDKNGGERQIVSVMLGQFNKIFIPEYYERAKTLGMTVDQVVILASIIEREAKIAEERDIISGVFHNRLKSKDPALKKLQSCATIQYILFKQLGIFKESLSLEDEKIDDPYNTYIYEGLPPGPISSPGRDSIIAALYPEEHDYLYFVSKEDGTGTHYFSTTYRDHVNAQLRAQKNKASN
ncbi:MAG TPA: endolytic transglycosylase MltG [Clostridiaceae bacterium]|nr:endolytic transglycosylase MltG [Clostridiaceae bacterium]